MPIPPHLITQLQDILRNFRAAHPVSAAPDGPGKALEAWLLMKLAQAANCDPFWRVYLHRGDGSRLPPGASFLFPAKMCGIPGWNVAAPGYVSLEYILDPSLDLELRCSLQWQGRSNAKHECDISAVPAEIATVLRSNGGGYPRGLPVIAIECKDKTSAGTLDETRETLARMFDLALVTKPAPHTPCRIFEDRTNRPVGEIWGRRRSTYVGFFANGMFGIARAGGFQAGAGPLARHYHIGHYDNLYAAGGASVNRILQTFIQILDSIQDNIIP